MITFLSITGCILTMTIAWFESKGKLWPVFVLGIVNGFCLVTLNAMLAIETNPTVAFMTIPSSWCIAMSIRGIVRLRRKHKSMV